MLPKLETELTRARALSMSLKQMLICAEELEDKHQPVGCAIFLANELDSQLERRRCCEGMGNTDC